VTIAAMEKAKLVYILNRDAAVNPMFAALEVDYSESDQDPTGEAFNIKQKRHVSDSLPLQLN
jgi:splicing factor 3B subunit 3